MPTPVSRDASPRASPPSRRRREPDLRRRRSVYLAALLSRLATTCARRTRSPSTADRLGRAGRSTAAAARPRSAALTASTARRDRPRASSTGSRRSSILPRVMRETSSRSSTSRVSCATWRSITSRAASARSSPSAGADAQDLERVADRRQRVAQLVRQHGEELVLAPVGLAQRLLGAAHVVDVDRREHVADELRRQARHADRLHPPALAVGAAEAQLRPRRSRAARAPAGSAPGSRGGPPDG